jgi:hypothetical protein
VGYFKNLEIAMQEEEANRPKSAAEHVAWDVTGVPVKSRNWSYLGYLLIGLALGVAVGVFL